MPVTADEKNPTDQRSFRSWVPRQGQMRLGAQPLFGDHKILDSPASCWMLRLNSVLSSLAVSADSLPAFAAG